MLHADASQLRSSRAACSLFCTIRLSRDVAETVRELRRSPLPKDVISGLIKVLTRTAEVVAQSVSD
jgi:hypothetical protein